MEMTTWDYNREKVSIHAPPNRKERQQGMRLACAL